MTDTSWIQRPLQLWACLPLTWLVLGVALMVDYWQQDFALVVNWNAIPEVMRDRVPGYAGAGVVVPIMALAITYTYLHVNRRRAGWVECGLVAALGFASAWLLVLQLSVAATYENVSGRGPGSFAPLLVLAGFVLSPVLMVLLVRKSRRARRAEVTVVS